MAEFQVSRVVLKLSELLSQEEFILTLHSRHLHDELAWMRDELQSMKCFLKDAEAKALREDVDARDWVTDVIQVACQAEDAIDMFLFKVKPHRQLRGFTACINRFKPSMFIARRQLVMEFGKIKENRNYIEDRGKRYGIQILGGEDKDIVNLPVFGRLHFSYEPDDIDVVGLFEDEKALLELLLDHQNEKHLFISIVGEDGMGKTTLARRLYRSNEVSQHFDIHIWLTNFSERPGSIMECLEKIFENIPEITKVELENVYSNLNPENSEEGRKLVVNYLLNRLYDSRKSKRYLMVLDDFRPDYMIVNWENDLQRAFPNVKVLITSTPYPSVFLEGRSYYMHVPPLNDDGSMKLLLKKAFPNQQVEIIIRDCPKELLDVCYELTRICHGLPLALVLLGGFLSMKERTPAVWVQLLERLNKWESEGRTILKEIAVLSYNDLPWFVKPCFLYLIVFPKGYEIKADILVKLWVAEGFILQEEGKTMEDTGEAILEELAQRNLVQVTELRHDGSINKCIIHPVLLDLARSDRYTDFYCFICDVHGMNLRLKHDQGIRHLAIHIAIYREDMREFEEIIRSAPTLRTLMLFNKHFHSFVAFFNFFKKLELLRVLELSGVQYLPSKLPKEMGCLINLRYLGLRDQDLESLPSTIGNLRFLETIDMRNTPICSGIPDSLWKIKTLRHVLIDYVSPPQILDLTNLQTFEVVSLESLKLSPFEVLYWRLPNLRTFSVWIDEEHHATMLADVLSELKHLISLTISVDPRRNEAEILDYVIINMKDFRFHQHLQSLCVQGRLPTEPRFLSNYEFPSCLTELQLSHSILEEDPMPTLEKLQHLVYLKLSHEVYTGTKMVCSAGGFPLLKHLVIREFALPNLEEWHVKGGAMPSLALLELYSCHNLKMFPDLQHVKSLGELKLDFLSTELKARLQSHPEGEDWHKIKDVPKLTIY